jgi:hypothetical protein
MWVDVDLMREKARLGGREGGKGRSWVGMMSRAVFEMAVLYPLKASVAMRTRVVPVHRF